MEQIIDHSESSRDRVFSPLITLKAFIFQTLSTDGSCRQAVMHVLSERLQQGREAISIMTGAYCKARQRLPYESLIARAARINHKTPRKISFMTAVQLVNEGVSGLFIMTGKVLKYLVKPPPMSG